MHAAVLRPAAPIDHIRAIPASAPGLFSDPGGSEHSVSMTPSADPRPIPTAMALMASQHGAATDRELRACGVSVGVQRRLIERGLLVRFAWAFQ